VAALILTTNPGIEDITAEEARAKLGAEIVSVKEGLGRVIVRVRDEYLEHIRLLGSVHRAHLLLARGSICPEASCLDTVRSIVAESGAVDFLVPTGSFAVRVNRVGSHEYRSLDVARVAGDAVIAAAVEKRGWRPRVDLDYPSTIIHIDVIEREILVSIELGGELSWHRRGYRVYDHPAALKPTLAYAMIMLSGARDGDHLVDPMCGGGTVAIEAAYMFEDSRLTCIDRNPRHIAGARLNARAALVHRRIRFLVGDARRLSGLVDGADVLVSNPPYGIRLGSPRQVRRVYREFLREATRVFRKSITIITPEYEYAKRVLEENGWKIVHERRVAHGNLYPHIIVAAP